MGSLKLETPHHWRRLTLFFRYGSARLLSVKGKMMMVLLVTRTILHEIFWADGIEICLERVLNRICSRSRGKWAICFDTYNIQMMHSVIFFCFRLNFLHYRLLFNTLTWAPFGLFGNNVDSCYAMQPVENLEIDNKCMPTLEITDMRWKTSWMRLIWIWPERVCVVKSAF